MAATEGGQLHARWREALAGEFEQDYMLSLRAFLAAEKQRGVTIFPPGPLIFNAYNLTPPEAVRVVILGQDPYHGPGQAHGLCFSVPPGVPPPPSLQNVFAEIRADLGVPLPAHGCLAYWAGQGVLLLNAILTVARGQPGSHADRGWETFTDATIRYLNDRTEGLVFLLWGSYAQKKGKLVDRERHTVLTAPHPSPLSAHRGFLGCRHFSQANASLVARARLPIDWSLPAAPELPRSVDADDGNLS